MVQGAKLIGRALPAHGRGSILPAPTTTPEPAPLTIARNMPNQTRWRRAFCVRNLYTLSISFTGREATNVGGILEIRQQPNTLVPNFKFGLFFAHSGGMPFSRTLTEKLLPRQCWLAMESRSSGDIDAARAYRIGHPEAAAAIVEIAEAAEEVWLGTKAEHLLT
jgi:hypothetical protein